MAVDLTHVGEAIVSSMINSMRWSFIELCQLQNKADKHFLSTREQMIAFANVELLPYGGIAFDGASRVDLVLLIQENLGVPFELKLGQHRLTKSRIDEEWLNGCTLSHQDKRFKGNMMSILERKFPTSVAPDCLKVKIDGRAVRLTDEWFVIVRSSVRGRWERDAMRPFFSPNARLLAFESIVERFGGREPFNEMVAQLLNFDFYSAWIQCT